MANDDRQSEQFIREVDEELRRAQLKAIWDRFAPLIIGVCILVVAVTAGYRGWLWWQERQAAQAGDRFMAALEAIEDGKREEGEAALAAIAEEGAGGYSVLARLRLAAERAEADDAKAAIGAYDAVAADADASEPLRNVARIRAAMLALDSGDLEGARERAAPLDQPGNPWRHVAREVLGTAAYQAGKLVEARGFFSAIQEDAETPPDLWFRSGMMVALIDGQLAAPGGEAASAEDAEGAEAAAETPPAEAPSTEPAEQPEPAPPPEPAETLPVPTNEPPVMQEEPAAAAPEAPAPAADAAAEASSEPAIDSAAPETPAEPEAPIPPQ
jgi:hypothetical protein